MSELPANKSIVLFDGVCNFCDSSINRIIRHDKKDKFLFAPLQSEIGKKLAEQYSINTEKIDSIILIENNNAYTKSSAILRISRHLNRLYPLMFGFMIIPAFIRNAVYDLIARNRYKWFGKKDTCMIPTAEVRSKFISE
jgi:predicted DCC family thiol-disulfide oxidoreductase YuxK